MIGLVYRAADALRRHFRGNDAGRTGEDLAHRYLRSRGCTIVARGYRPTGGGGEIDLIAWHREALVFVEVKTRSTAEFGAPERAVGSDKESHLRYAARDYARRAGVDWTSVRFDIISVVLGKPPQIDWIQDAFGR